MKKRFVLIFSLLLTFPLIGWVLWSSSKSLAQQNAATGVSEQGAISDPFVQLNQKARSAKKDDSTAIREIADVVVDSFAPMAAPAGATEAIKDRLVAAEVNYWKEGRGILEANVVRTVNELAERVGAPAYAKTDVGQVRFVRTSMMGGLPYFIAQESPTSAKEKKKGKAIGSSINDKMSPLEATFVTMILLQQKMTNEDFQLEPKDWIARLKEKKLERWQSFRDGSAYSESQAGPKLVKRQSNPKSDEISQCIARATASMSSSDLRNLADHSLDILGINR